MKSRCLAAALIAVSLLSVPASAQSLIVDEATIGLRAKLPRGPLALHGAQEGLDAWLPFELTVSNPGKEEVRGTLYLREARLSARRHIHTGRSLTLAPGAHLRLRFPVLYDPITSYRLEFVDASGGRVDLRTSAGKAPEIALPLERPTGERMVLFTRRRGDLRPLEKLQAQPKADSLVRDWVVAEIDPARLPESGLSYHRVDIVVLDDLPLDELSQDQQQALLEFVARGGLLWVSTLSRKPGAGAQVLDAALPGQALEVVERTRPDCLEAFSDHPLPPRPRTFMQFEPRPGAKPWSDERIVVERRHDQGWIYQSGFQLSERGILDGRILFQQLLRRRSRGAVLPPTAYTTRLRRALTFALRSTTRKSVPPLNTVLTLLGVYLVVVVALPFLTLRRSGRYEFAWVFVAVVAVGGMFAVDLLGRSYLKPSSAARISVVGGGAAGGTHRRTSHWAVFSEKGGDLPIRFGEGAPAPFPMQQGREALLWSDEQEVTLRTHPQDTTLFLSSEECELPGGLEATVLGDRSVRLRVRPGGPRLLGAWAFDHLGKAVQVLGADSGPPDADDRFAAALRVLQSHTAQVASRERRPALLYRYDGGSPLLTNLPEESLDVGIMLLDLPKPLQPRERLVTCEREQVEDAVRDNGYTAVYTFSHEVPPGVRVSEISLNLRRTYVGWGRQRKGRQQLRLGLYDWERRSWETVRRMTLPSGDLVRISPLGIARGRVSLMTDDNLVPEVRLRLRRTP